ncbi:Outer membrane receptor proteins, mostly Fe transport [Cnuella takakiae]|uniref:Outer membrane receptor proteins, mostly Fe transport n=1 Tax=Cnuella takakiae TaxID=1302690 RepID=A0A1M4WY97_9BACT|nr:outer membrane beta-barrel family protein [Cnuella takakiae]SHE86137.1 Outer membrane receptor proteins, mostly Fe transport [Cnuella takakiae]
MMYRFLIGMVMTVCCLPALAQEEIEPPAELQGGRPQQTRTGIIGKVVDSRNRKGVEGVTVQLYAQIKDSTGSSRLTAVGTQVSKANGDFNFTTLPQADSFQVLMSGVNFEPFEQWVVAGRQPLTDLGNLVLSPSVQTLQSVVVTAQRSALQMGVDRRVFSADRSLTAAGGTAVDLMKNIPSITVDVDGNISMRNAAPQIFVDGRPTILTLDQIPADNIERVELITNPSAKFDASTSGGIVNIILKKNKRVGMNGILSAGIGAPDIRTGSINLNIRQGKFNFFAVGSLFQGGGIARGESRRQNLNEGLVTSYFNQNSQNDRLRRFGNIRVGADFFLDNRNTISLTQSAVNGNFSNTQRQDQEFLDEVKLLERTGNRLLTSRSNFRRYNTQLNYVHKFPQAGRELSANVNYNYGNGGDNTFIDNLFFNPNGTPTNASARLHNTGSNSNDQLTFQVDYETTQGENGKLETGVRSFINNQQSIFNSFSVNNGLEIKLPLSNNYKYRELINAAYITYTNKIGSIGYQAGLRAEHSQFDGELVDSARKFGYTLPTQLRNIFDGLFPSLYLTREVGEGQQLQLNYSRRIRRPDFWNLNPFVDINDPLNISQGNPQLRPEFTNSLEFNYSTDYKGGNFLGSVYLRNTQGDITRYSDTLSKVQFAQLNNSAIDSNAILNTFVNADHTNRLGAEFTLQQKFGTRFDLTPTVNFQYRAVRGRVGALVLDNEGFNWEAKLIANYRAEPANKSSIFTDFSVQAIGEYESREVVPQGVRIPNYSVDLALRKDFLKNKKATVTFSVQDLFNHLRFGSELQTATFYQESWSRRNVRSFRLVFTYKFGDPNFAFGKRNGDRDRDNED